MFYVADGQVWATGLDNSDSNKFKISTDGSNAAVGVSTVLTIDTSGNVGIGTASPATYLHIKRQNVTGRGQLSLEATDHVQMTMYNGASTEVANWYHDIPNNVSYLGTASSGGQLQLMTGANANAVRIDSSGYVGIGKTNPAVPLDIVGALTATGTITGGNIVAKYQDVAEWVPSAEQVSAGTVVVLDTTKSNQVISSTEAYDTRVAGVVSAQPGLTLGEGGAGKVLVSTTGRVLVRVDASRGPIHIGDLLVTSDIPGLAMKSEPIKIGGRMMHMPGTLIGKALEPLERVRARFWFC